MKMLFVVAAGNSFRPLNELHVYPASLAWNRDNVISVGALNRTGDGLWHGEFRELKKGSNSGELVEVLAPGEDIPCASNVVEDKALYSRTSGSSMATALVSATASLLLERELTP